MHKLARLFAASWAEQLTYRADILLWTLAETAVPAVSLAVWYSVTSSTSAALSAADTLTYFLLVILVKYITDVWTGFFLSREILTGAIIKNLVRPISIFWEHIMNLLTEKIMRIALPAIILCSAFILFPSRFSAPIYDLSNIILFIISVVLALALSFVFNVMFAMLSFWFEDAQQIYRLAFILQMIGTGVLIPFALMPAYLFDLLAWLPFRYIVSAPIEIIMGRPLQATAASLIATQVLWIIFFAGLTRILWRVGLRRYAIPGQ